MINIKKEFINAIIGLFRLEKNIFIIGAVEKIVEDVEEQDFIMLLAFLGDRKSEYERPIESITSGVKEFYDKKEGGKLRYAETKAIGIVQLLQTIKQNNLKLEPIYQVRIQAGEHDSRTIKMDKADIKLIASLGGIDNLLGIEEKKLIHLLKEKYFGKKIRKTITEKIEEDDKKYLFFKPRSF